jgi:hypothetical protein
MEKSCFDTCTIRESVIYSIRTAKEQAETICVKFRATGTVVTSP